MDDWNDALFNRWQELRKSHKEAKRAKDHRAVIKIGAEIIELAGRAPFIGILVAVFQKDAGDAYVKLDDAPTAIVSYGQAIQSFEAHRAAGQLRSPDDFLADIEKLQKKLAKLKTANKKAAQVDGKI